MKVLVIGETCVDKFIYGKINRLSPEAPVPVFNPTRKTTNPGMAGNTTANIKALVSDATIWHLTQEENITKTRYVEDKSNHMFIRVDEGEEIISQFKWTPYVDVMLGEADVVIVSDYNKGFLSNGDLKEIARKSKLSILDSKRKLTNDIIKKYTWVKLNESESLNNPDLDYKNIIVTLGIKGAKINNTLFESPNPQETIDVSGAGDTFVAAFALNYYKTKDEVAAVKYANIMASKVVTKKGVTTP